MTSFRLRMVSDHFPATHTQATPNHFVVMWGERVVGSMDRQQGGPRDGLWTWAITWPIHGHTNAEHGLEDSRDAAKAAFKAAWAGWAVKHGIQNDPADPRNPPERPIPRWAK